MRNKVLILMMCMLLLGSSRSAMVWASEAAESIDLSLHTETAGEFTSIYTYENPFKGQDTSKGVIFEFKAAPTWEVSALGTIFSLLGTGENDGRLYFTPGSYLGYNSGNYGGFFDANLKDYLLVEDYIKDQATIKIEIVPSGFSVYANGKLAYDQSILDDETRGSGDYTGSSDFSPVLDWIAHADTLNFGYGSWWNNVHADEAYIELSDVRFQLADGTVVFDKLTVDQALIDEAAKVSESISIKSKVSLTIPEYTGKLTSVLTGTEEVDYDGFSAIPYVIVAIVVVLIVSGLIILKMVQPTVFKFRSIKGLRKKQM